MRRMLLGVCLLLLAGCGGAVGSSTSISHTPQPTHYKIGQQVSTSGWVVVITSAQTMAQLPPAPDPQQPQLTPTPITPPGGDAFLVLGVTLQNVTGNLQDNISSHFVLHTTDGQSYQPYGDTFPGPVATGSATQGAIIYEVPDTVKTFTLAFWPGQDIAATWDISL